MKFKNIFSFFAVGSQLFTVCFSATAQMNRGAQAANISTNIYQNATHAITGASLQSVMLNQNNSYVNLLSDTNLLDIRIFSPYANYSPGMGCFYEDSIYMNIAAAHGAWTRSQWYNLTPKYECNITCSDTGSGGSVATVHTVKLVTESLIPFSDTNTVIATKHSVLSTDTSYFPATGIEMTRSSTGIYVSNTGLLFSDSNITGGFLTPTQLNKDTANANHFLVGQPYLYSYVANHAINYLTDTVSGSGATPKLVTQKYLNTILGSYLTIADSSFMSSKTFMESYFANHSINYLTDTVSGSGSKPVLITAKRLSIDTTNANSFLVGQAYLASYVTNHLASYLTIADSSFMSSKTYMKSYVADHAVNYLTDTVSGSGATPKLVTQKYQATILGSYLTISDSSFMSSKTFMESYFADHSINYLTDTVSGSGATPKLVTQKYQATILGSYLTIADSSFMSSKTFMESYFANHSINYLTDTVSGSGATPKLVTQKYQATILGSYLTIADSSFMSSKTFMESYFADHSINYLTDTVSGSGATPKLVTQKYQATILGSYLTIADSSFMSSKTFMESYFANHSINYLTDTVGGSGATPKLATKTSVWSLTGNSGTNPSANFIGTIDTATLKMKVDNSFSGWIDDGKYANTFFGYKSGIVSSVVNSGNTGIGYEVLLVNTSGLGNSGFGSQALTGNTSGYYNTAIGNQAFLDNTTASNNTGIGYQVLLSNTSGPDNTASGFRALYHNTTGSSSAAFGLYAGYTSTGSGNTFLGDSAGAVNTTGRYNSYLGYQAGLSNKSLSNQIYLGDSAGATAPTAVKFSGLLEPYYSGNYNTGTSGQVLTSQGSSGGAPQWETPTAYTAGTGLTLTGSAFSLTSPVTIATGGMGGTHISTDSIGSDSNSFYINGHSQALENDSVYYTSATGNNGGYGVKINVSLNNMVDGETVNTLYYKKTTKFSVLTFPANASATAYTISQSSHGLVSGQTFSAETTTGTTIYLIKTQLFHSRYLISIIQITP